MTNQDAWLIVFAVIILALLCVAAWTVSIIKVIQKSIVEDALYTVGIKTTVDALGKTVVENDRARIEYQVRNDDRITKNGNQRFDFELDTNARLKAIEERRSQIELRITRIEKHLLYLMGEGYKAKNPPAWKDGQVLRRKGGESLKILSSHVSTAMTGTEGEVSSEHIYQVDLRKKGEITKTGFATALGIVRWKGNGTTPFCNVDERGSGVFDMAIKVEKEWQKILERKRKGTLEWMNEMNGSATDTEASSPTSIFRHEPSMLGIAAQAMLINEEAKKALWSMPLVWGKDYDVTVRYIGEKLVDENGWTKVRFHKSTISMVAKEDSFRISGGEGKTLADVFDPKEVEIIKVEEVKNES